MYRSLSSGAPRNAGNKSLPKGPAPDAADVSASASRISEMIYRRVRADIVHGRLAPGRKLPLDRMREAYGSAVSTLREQMVAGDWWLR